MTSASLQQQTEAYLEAYNNFNVPGMLATLHPDVEFKNIANEQVTLSLKGLPAFKAQAELAAGLFSQRKQTITSLQIDYPTVVATINYQGALAADLPNGLKAGQLLQLKGKSIFRFENDLIISIEDIS